MTTEHWVYCEIHCNLGRYCFYVEKEQMMASIWGWFSADPSWMWERQWAESFWTRFAEVLLEKWKRLCHQAKPESLPCHWDGCICVWGLLMSVKRDPWGTGKRNSSSHCSCSSTLASHVYPGRICSDGSSSGQFRVHLFRSSLLFTVNHVTTNPIPVQRITYITIHRWKVTIPLRKLISLLAYLGK